MPSSFSTEHPPAYVWLHSRPGDKINFAGAQGATVKRVRRRTLSCHKTPNRFMGASVNS